MRDLMKRTLRLAQKVSSLGIALCISLTVVSSSSSAYGYNEALARKYERILTQEICKDSQKWLRCYEIDPATCSTIFTPRVQQCVQTLLSDKKSTVKNKQDVEALSSTISSCIHASFTGEYGDSKLANEDCKDIR